jgi:hypothetical protein
MSKRRTLLVVLAFALSTSIAASLGTFAGAAPAISQVAPANTTPPAISGTPQQGQTLTATTGQWSGDQPITYAFQWLRCDATGGNCIAIGGANGQTYTVTGDDVGHRLRVQVTATNADGSSQALSDPTAVVSSVAAPASTAEPSVAGTPQVGQTLTASNGTWTGQAPITYTYQWQQCDAAAANCQPIPGATSQTYVVQPTDVGKRLNVLVKATNSGGSTSKGSNATAVVQPAGPAGAIKLANGKTSVPASSLSLPSRLIIDRVQFSPNPVRSVRSAITIRVHVSDTAGDWVRGALVFLRSTPLVTGTPPEAETDQAGYVTFKTSPRAGFPTRRGNVQFFVRARKAGDDPLAGISSRRLVQVATR